MPSHCSKIHVFACVRRKSPPLSVAHFVVEEFFSSSRCRITDILRRTYYLPMTWLPFCRAAFLIDLLSILARPASDLVLHLARPVSNSVLVLARSMVRSHRFLGGLFDFVVVEPLFLNRTLRKAVHFSCPGNCIVSCISLN